MVTIRVKDHVAQCVSNDDGALLFYLIKQSFDRDEPVEVSFDGIYSLPTSFVNSAFVELLEYYHFCQVKKLLSFKDTTRQINEVIKKRFTFEAERQHQHCPA